MADNITVTPGTGKTIAADEVTIDGATVLVQRIKVTWGVAGVGVDASASNPFPVAQTGALPAGSAVVGQVGIDQTTPGTTNGVVTKNTAGNAVAFGAGAVGATVPRVTHADDDPVVAALTTPVAVLPKTPAMASTDMDEPILIDSTSATARTIKGAVVGQACRMHAFEYQVDGACDVTIKRGATVLYVRKFGATGGGGSYGFRERPYFKTATNEALTIETSESRRLTGSFETKTEA